MINEELKTPEEISLLESYIINKKDELKANEEELEKTILDIKKTQKQMEEDNEQLQIYKKEKSKNKIFKNLFNAAYLTVVLLICSLVVLVVNLLLPVSPKATDLVLLKLLLAVAVISIPSEVLLKKGYGFMGKFTKKIDEECNEISSGELQKKSRIEHGKQITESLNNKKENCINNITLFKKEIEEKTKQFESKKASLVPEQVLEYALSKEATTVQKNNVQDIEETQILKKKYNKGIYELPLDGMEEIREK